MNTKGSVLASRVEQLPANRTHTNLDAGDGKGVPFRAIDVNPATVEEDDG